MTLATEKKDPLRLERGSFRAISGKPQAEALPGLRNYGLIP